MHTPYSKAAWTRHTHTVYRILDNRYGTCTVLHSPHHTHTRAAQNSRRVTRARTITILACYCPDEVAMSADSRIIKFGFYDHEEFEERGRKKHRARCKFCKPSTPFGGQTVRPDCAIQHSMAWPRMFFLCQLAVLRWREISAMEDWSWGHIAPNFSPQMLECLMFLKCNAHILSFWASEPENQAPLSWVQWCTWRCVWTCEVLCSPII